MTLLGPPNGAKPRPSQNKRNDIQVLRFVAIAAVLGFHLRPKSVPQGYLGVDMFFVISGYLMTLITASSQGAITTAIIKRFYERRLKRLCPAYVFTLFAAIVVGKVVLIATDFESLRTDSFWALIFGTNIQSMLAQEDYFQLVSEYKFLLHTWSLSVEVQFYAAAPFILAWIARSQRPLITCGVISGLSLGFQTFVPSSTWAFGCVLSRIWQFLIGTVVFYLEKRRQSAHFQSNGNVKTVTSTIILVILLLAPELSQNSFYKVVVRVLATSLTGILMYYAPTVNERKSLQPLVNFMALLGDASYSIYLVHWPMIIFAQYLDIFDGMNIFTQLGYILTVAFVQYYLFEKPMISLPSQRIFTICGIFYFLAAVVLVSSFNTEIPEMSTKVNVRKMDPVLANQQINKDCDKKWLKCPRAPELDAIVPNTTTNAAFFCGFRGHGKGTVFVTGNSYALHQLEAVQKALNGQYETLYFAARPGCLAFDGVNQMYAKRFGCAEVVGLTEKILKTLKPDVMVIIQRIDNHVSFTSRRSGNTTTADYLQKTLANYSKYTKKIFVVEPNRVVGYNVPLFLAKTLKNGQPIDNVFITLAKHKQAIDHGWNQMLDAIKTCPRCEPIWIRNQLCHAEKCLLYEKKSKLALYCDNAHLSTIGIDVIMPAFRTALKKAFKEIKGI